jgi:flagellar biosynthesis/type III secretory pathway M-ring protein FliF/YscJ
MSNGLVWLIVILLIGLIFWALVRDYDRRMQRSAQEYERELAEQKSSLMRAGLVELDKFVGDQKNKTAAVEYLKDEQQGQTKTGGKDDEADRTESSGQ